MRTFLIFVFLLSIPPDAFCWTFNEVTNLKSGYLICASKDSYDTARNMVDGNDREAFVRFASTGICNSTKEGMEVYVIGSHAFHGTFEVRPKGETRILWVDNRAIRDSFTVPSSEENSQQTQASIQNREKVFKLDGLMTEGGQTIIFISKGSQSSKLKVGDRVCEGEIIRTYAPGENDGITSPQNIDKYEYRVKIHFAQEEKVFKNGDVICEDADNEDFLGP